MPVKTKFQSRFPDAIRVRVPLGLPDAIEAAARRGHTTASEWTRRALLRVLRDDGLHLLADGGVSGAPQQGGRHP